VFVYSSRDFVVVGSVLLIFLVFFVVFFVLFTLVLCLVLRAGLKPIGPIAPMLGPARKGPRAGVIYSRLFKDTLQVLQRTTLVLAPPKADHSCIPIVADVSELPLPFFLTFISNCNLVLIAQAIMFYSIYRIINTHV